jgi:tRNA pseudouridine55 synthase
MTSGFLVINKPPGITSHDVVASVRAVTGIKKVGHTGTLDPFATGVLPLALGKATRLIQYLDEAIKVYDATVSLGTATDTGDMTGTVIREAPLPQMSTEEAEAVVTSFVGERLQVPPAYSAVKVKGKPLYHYARRGEIVEAAPRKVIIHNMELLSYSEKEFRVMITCSRGTYARVLADELAIEMGSAGHLSALERPRSGPFFLDDALDMPGLAEMVAQDLGYTWQEVLLSPKISGASERVKWKSRNEVRGALTPWIRSPMKSLSHLPLMDVNQEMATHVRKGGTVPAAPGGVMEGGRYLVVSGRELIAVAERTQAGPRALRVIQG